MAPAISIAIVAVVIILGVIFFDKGNDVKQPPSNNEENITSTATTTVATTSGQKTPTQGSNNQTRTAKPIVAGGIDLSKVDFIVDGKPFVLGIDPVTKEKRELLMTQTSDLNRDGINDVGAVLVHYSAGSGTFFYATYIVGNGMGGGKSLGTFYLGDRVRVQNLAVDDNEFIVRYYDRLPGEAFITEPSVSKRRAFFLSGNSLVEDIK